MPAWLPVFGLQSVATTKPPQSYKKSEDPNQIHTVHRLLGRHIPPGRFHAKVWNAPREPEEFPWIKVPREWWFATAQEAHNLALLFRAEADKCGDGPPPLRTRFNQAQRNRSGLTGLLLGIKVSILLLFDERFDESPVAFLLGSIGPAEACIHYRRLPMQGVHVAIGKSKIASLIVPAGGLIPPR